MTLLSHGTEFRSGFQRRPQGVAHKLQTVFFEMLLKELKSDMPGGDLGNMPGGDMVADLMSQALASKLSQQVDLGLGRSMGLGAEGADNLHVPRMASVSRVLRGSIMDALPVHGRITSPYGFRRDPIDGKRKFHHGVDIGAPAGAPIRSSVAGKIVFVGTMGGYGKVVKVRQPDGVELLLGHCSKLLVKSGDEVRIGQTVAEVGSTGRSTGPHVHMEIRFHGASVDPLHWLSGRMSLAQEKAIRDDELFGAMIKPGP